VFGRECQDPFVKIDAQRFVVEPVTFTRVDDPFDVSVVSSQGVVPSQ
jgi:hypothetical protein